ncbi:S8 family peptidase, partial [Streptomyces anulatus]|uniref:S8 family peptidase n=1 Tax=Streptomyces anulatus TaxID=1892 RepID=UPI003649373A
GGAHRIDQPTLPVDEPYTTSATGMGVKAYVVDTGIDAAHSEFGGRVVNGYDAVGDGRGGMDCNGHGTHVAGTVGGATSGVAKDASLVNVRVLNCEGRGTWAGILAGFDWVAKDAERSGGPAVLNASLGGDRSTSVDTAVEAVADAGVLPVVAAGNDNRDACDVSPAGSRGCCRNGGRSLNSLQLSDGTTQNRPQRMQKLVFPGCGHRAAPSTRPAPRPKIGEL